MKRIELAYRSGLFKYEDAKKQLEIRVIKNYLNLVTRKQNLTNLEEYLRTAEQLLEKNQIARQNGLLSELAFLNSRLSVETARYDLNNARGTYKNDVEAFLAVLGMETGTDLNFSGTLEISPVQFDPERLIMEYLPKRPDIINQRNEIERMELSKKVTTLNSRAPSLELGATWRGGSPGNNTGGLGAPFTDNVSGSLTMRIPVDSWIPGTRQNQTVRSANAEVEKASLELQNTEINAKTEIRSLVSNLNNIWESLEIARLREEIARRTVEAAEEGFQKGTVEFQDLENSRRDLDSARQRLLQGQYDSQSLLLDLAAALNVDWRILRDAGRGLQ